MPKGPVVNQKLILERLMTHLSQSGPLNATALCQFLNISQSTFSRLVAQAQGSILRIGSGRNTLYALHRGGTWGKPEIPIVVVDEKGGQRVTATLHPLSPKGFYLKSHTEIFLSQIYESLPYFFEDLRPSGFLGRLVPRLYPALGLPEDISLWTDDDCLVYLTRYGFDEIGNLIIGENAGDLALENRIKQSDVVAEADRQKRYPELAELVLSKGIPGSSAAGEQPKFLAICKTKEACSPVLVKFSPPLSDAISRRVADLLICEHITHAVLAKHGQTSLKSCLIRGKDRLFLEVERFDRNASWGRRGVLSLRALGLGFGCLSASWSQTAEFLVGQKRMDPTTYETIVWLDVFSKLIGNSDTHAGNISFFCEGEKLLGLTPVYDMLPMMYAPQQNQLVTRIFDPNPPKFFERPVWNDALNAASDFWAQAQNHPQISAEFKVLTAGNESKLASFPKITAVKAGPVLGTQT